MMETKRNILLFCILLTLTAIVLSGCRGDVWVKNESATLRNPANDNVGNRVARRAWAQAPLEIIFDCKDEGRYYLENQPNGKHFEIRHLYRNRYIAQISDSPSRSGEEREIVAEKISNSEYMVRFAESPAWVNYTPGN